MKREMTKAALILCLAASFAATDAGACIHFAKSYGETITEGKKEALSFHDGKNAHLVLRTQLSAEKALPPEIAWILPFPSLPKSYQEVDAKVFEELFRIVPALAAVKGGQRGGPGAQNPVFGGLKIHETQVVGDYRIEPIEILAQGKKTGGELNAWLSKNRFNPMPDELQKRYLKKGAVFLAIRLKPSGDSASIKPLHVTYPADRVSFPLKFTHDTRSFGIDWYVFTRGALPQVSIAQDYLRHDGEGKYRPDRAASPILTGLLGPKEGAIVRFSAAKLNVPGRELKDLKDDPSFSRSELGL